MDSTYLITVILGLLLFCWLLCWLRGCLQLKESLQHLLNILMALGFNT